MKKNDSAMNPIALFFQWYEEARTGKGGLFPKNRLIAQGTQVIRRLLEVVLPWSSLLRPDIATLATTPPDNKPAARSILFKGYVDDGFSFYTDYASSKGKELDLNPSAVMVFYWHFPPRQVRIDGGELVQIEENNKAMPSLLWLRAFLLAQIQNPSVRNLKSWLVLCCPNLVSLN